MSSDIAIKLDGLSKSYHIYDKPRDRLKQMFFWGRRQYYREFWALHNVSIDIYRGQTVGLLGANGAGKSTLLQLVCGTVHPTGGSVQASGRVAALLELGSGFNPDFTGRENVYMNASVLGLRPEEIDERFESIESFAAIGPFIDQPIKTYSSGMVIRLAFAVQASVDPDILIVDEALAVGDIRFQNKCIRRMEEIKRGGATIIFVTHAPGMIESFCDRVIWLRDGSIFKDGDPARIVRQYVNWMSHGIEDEHKKITARSELASLYRDQGWQGVTEAHNVRSREGVAIDAVRMWDEGREEVLDHLTDLDAHDVLMEAIISVDRSIDAPLFGLCFHNELNEPVFHFNNQSENQTLPSLLAGHRYHVKYRMRIPPLREGNYLVSVGLDDGVPGDNTLLCHVYDAWLIRVQRSYLRYKQFGYVQLEHPRITYELLEGDIDD